VPAQKVVQQHRASVDKRQSRPDSKSNKERTQPIDTNLGRSFFHPPDFVNDAMQQFLDQANMMNFNTTQPKIMTGY
jgi:hypothetical protein